MITLSVIIVIAVILIAMYFRYNNSEIALRKEAEAQEKAIGAVRDTMWKTIKEKAGVSEKYRETFEKIYPEIISGRYKQDGSETFKMINESNPDFDTSLYKDLMQTIECQREAFTNAQKRMLDIIRERETLIESLPQKFFISNKKKIDYKPIVSDATDSVMKTHIDNEMLEL